MAAESRSVLMKRQHYVKVTQSGVGRLDEFACPMVKGLYTDGIEDCLIIGLIGKAKISLMHATCSVDLLAAVKEELAWLRDAACCVIIHNSAYDQKRNKLHELSSIKGAIRAMLTEDAELLVFRAKRLLLTRQGKFSTCETPRELLFPPLSDYRNQVNLLNSFFSVSNTAKIDLQFEKGCWQALPTSVSELNTALNDLQQLHTGRVFLSKSAIMTTVQFLLKLIYDRNIKFYFIDKLRQTFEGGTSDQEILQNLHFFAIQLNSLLRDLAVYKQNKPQFSSTTEVLRKLSELVGVSFIIVETEKEVRAIATCGDFDYFNEVAGVLKAEGIASQLVIAENPLQTSAESSPLRKVGDKYKRCLYTIRIPDIGVGTAQAKAILAAHDKLMKEQELSQKLSSMSITDKSKAKSSLQKTPATFQYSQASAQPQSQYKSPDGAKDDPHVPPPYLGRP